MEIISRKEAIARGLRRYFTGKPCKHGHLTMRYTKSTRCIACNKTKNDDWYMKNKDEIRRSYKENRDEINRRGRLSYYKHRKTRLEHTNKMARKSRAAFRALKEIGIEI